jgi:hypothetical protein
MSDPLTTDRPADSTSLPGRAELILVCLIFLVACGLRIAWPARMAVEHFDEGVYASNLFFHDRAGTGHYPDQHLYAPPLLPFLIECAMIVLGTSNFAPMAVSIVAGSLTPLLVWWVGRRWFGSTSGLTAATLAALNDVHIVFSRTALTDVLLCLFLLGAVYFLHEALTTRNRLAFFAAGGVTGLAWWTKYNGWLPLAIGLAGLLPWRLWGGPGVEQSHPISWGQRWLRLPVPLAIWSLVAIIAFLIWSPWLVTLQEKGGYAAVAANHRGYFMGISEWTTSFAAQARKISLLDGIPTCCSLLAALALAIVRLRQENRRFTWNMLLCNGVALIAFAVAGMVCVIEGANVILTSLGAIGTIVGLGRPLAGWFAASDRARTDATEGGLAAWLLTAWFAGLSLTVPLYTPYPRLMLPLLVTSWLGVGSLIDAIVCRIRAHAEALMAVAHGTRPLLLSKGRQRHGLSRARPVFLLAVAVVALAATKRSPLERGVPGWESRTGLARLAPTILDDACREAGLDRDSQVKRLAIYTYAEPALLFNLRLAGAEFVNPVKDVVFADPDAPAPRLPSFLVLGPQAWRTRGFGEQLAKALPRLQLAGKYRYAPSNLVLLDGPLIRSDRPTEYEISLYRIR